MKTGVPRNQAHPRICHILLPGGYHRLLGRFDIPESLRMFRNKTKIGRQDDHPPRGTALKESYNWILHHAQFQRLCDSNDSQVLSIKGDPGKGKNMLLCDIISELSPTTRDAHAGKLYSNN